MAELLVQLHVPSHQCLFCSHVCLRWAHLTSGWKRKKKRLKNGGLRRANGKTYLKKTQAFGYVWMICIYKSKFKNACFSQLSKYCRSSTSTTFSKEMSHKSILPSHSLGGYTLTWCHMGRDIQRLKGLRFPGLQPNLWRKFFQVASTSGASPIQGLQSCNLSVWKINLGTLRILSPQRPGDFEDLYIHPCYIGPFTLPLDCPWGFLG